MQTCNLFVYGTLRQGERANFFLRDGSLLRSAIRFHGFRLLTHGPYPFAMLADAQDSIVGDIYTIPTRLLGRLDEYEGVNSGLYTREEYLHEGIPFFIYIAQTKPQKDRLEIIASGDWKVYRNSLR
ncbi:MAG: gamma-glutamylcyclotransferase family protein [Spirochaetota bacterium]